MRGYIKFKEKLPTKSIKYVYPLILFSYYDLRCNQMKNKDKNTPLFQAIPKSKQNIVDTKTTSISLRHLYMTEHVPGLVTEINTVFLWAKTSFPFEMMRCLIAKAGVTHYIVYDLFQ